MMFVSVRQTDSTKARSDKGRGNPLGIFFKYTEFKHGDTKTVKVLESSRKTPLWHSNT